MQTSQKGVAPVIILLGVIIVIVGGLSVKQAFDYQKEVEREL